MPIHRGAFAFWDEQEKAKPAATKTGTQLVFLGVAD
jgi:hypothetical protein